MSLEMSPFDRPHTAYDLLLTFIVTMALSGVVSEIFNVGKCRDLEIGVRGHSRFNQSINQSIGLFRNGSQVAK